jgi:hypothetical protein
MRSTRRLMDRLQQAMHSAFEAELPHRLRRAARVTLQAYVPAHWFTAVATECAEMYVAGAFYGAIAVAHRYVDAVSDFLGDVYNIKGHWSAEGRFRRLNSEGSISAAALDSAITIVRGDLGFDGLNREHAHEYQRLAARAEECLRHVATIEAEVFAYRVEGERVTPGVPRHWLSGTMKSPQVKLRQLW